MEPRQLARLHDKTLAGKGKPMSYHKKRLHEYRFNSVDELLTYIEKTPCRKEYTDDGKLEGRETLKFTGTRTFNDAVELYRHGWKEGLANMVKALANAAPISIKVPSYYMDVAGAFPVVPLAVAGDPASMYNPIEEESRTKPVIKLMVNRAALATYSAQEITNYGAAVLSYVAALEAMGMRVELFVCAFCEASSSNSDYHYNIEILVKRADEIMELDKLAFVLVHPSFLRRFVFCHRHRANDLPKGSMQNCGRSCTMPHRDDVLTIAGIGALAHAGEKVLRSPVSIAKALEPMIKAQLSRLGAPSPSMVWDKD